VNTDQQDCLRKLGEFVKQSALKYVNENDEQWLLATNIMIAANLLGPDVKAIASLVGCPMTAVEEIAARLRASGLWAEDAVDYQDWGFDELGCLNFSMDLAVAKGIVERTTEMRDGYPVYRSLIYEDNR